MTARSNIGVLQKRSPIRDEEMIDGSGSKGGEVE